MINAVLKQLQLTRAFGVTFELKKIKVRLYKALYRKGILKSEVPLKRAFDMENAAILAYLRKRYDNVIQKYQQLDSSKTTGNIIKNRVIWTCWFQGEENAPEIVKRSIASIKRHSGDAKVVVITFKNLNHYISIPDVIQTKWKQGIISNTLFSDYLRLKVLNQYGGLWLDATCYCVKSIPEEVFSLPTYAPKNITDFIYKGNELMIASDLLITDYSSILFDYALLHKPIFLYLYDWEQYAQYRGFYTSPIELKLPYAYDGKALVDAINQRFMIMKY